MKKCLTAFVVIMVFIFSMTSSVVLSHETHEGDPTGAFEIVLPQSNNTYDVRIHIVRYDQWDNSLSMYGMDVHPHEITVTKPDGSSYVLAEEDSLFSPAWNDTYGHNEMYAEIFDIEAGSTITVTDITIEGELTAWSSYVRATVGVDVTSSSPEETVSFYDSPKDFIEDETVTLTGTSEILLLKNETTDTFLSLGGEFSLDYLLTNYNVVSFHNIEAIHIVGPILAQNYAIRTSNYVDDENFWYTDYKITEGYLAASDYSRGNISYVGSLLTRIDDSSNPSFVMNYDMDEDNQPNFIDPYLYTQSATTEIYSVIIHNTLTQYVSRNSELSFISPNNSGHTDVFQNDDFLDFDLLQEVVGELSIDLHNDGTIEGARDDENMVVIEEAGTHLTLDTEKSYQIIDATELIEINLILPDDYNYQTNAWLEQTTISFAGETLKVEQINGIDHSVFPVVLINGEEIILDTLGEDSEYGEVGNRIIFNLPNVVTDMETGNNRLSFIQSGNIPGHIVAPYADLWVYEQESAQSPITWNGGNINGCIIVASAQLGNIEMHMWPYSGDELLQTVPYELNVTKSFLGGDLSANTFTFELNLANSQDSLDGINTTNFPLTASSDTLGNVDFSDLVFDDVGEYKFTITEVIPSAGIPQVVYDYSEYELTVTVTADDNGTFQTLATVYQTKNSSGVSMTPVLVDEAIVFENEHNEFSLPCTGSTGTYMFYSVGFVLILISMFLGKKYFLKKHCK